VQVARSRAPAPSAHHEQLEHHMTTRSRAVLAASALVLSLGLVLAQHSSAEEKMKDAGMGEMNKGEMKKNDMKKSDMKGDMKGDMGSMKSDDSMKKEEMMKNDEMKK
jgi:pentapeptide MXKDX repeat protein